MTAATTSNSLLLSTWNQAKENWGSSEKSPTTTPQSLSVTDDYGSQFTVRIGSSFEGKAQVEADYSSCQITNANKKNVSWFSSALAYVVGKFHEGAARSIMIWSMASRTQNRLDDMGVKPCGRNALKTTLQIFFEENNEEAINATAKIRELNNILKATVRPNHINHLVCPATHQFLTLEQAVVLEYNNQQIIMSRDGISKVLINGECKDQFNKEVVVTRENILNGTLKPLTADNLTLNNDRSRHPLLPADDHITAWTYIRNQNA